MAINENPKNSNAANIERKRNYYDQLANDISIDGITDVQRDTAFDDNRRYNSAGIRLYYEQHTGTVAGLKDGILLEAGYDTTAPNMPVSITSWAYERASHSPELDLIDNRALDILCYDYRYTFVEKLQTIATKFRKEIETGDVSTNYMRQYYDVYCLLANEQVQEFIGSAEYLRHKKQRFPAEDFKLHIKENQAFSLPDPTMKQNFRQRYERTKALYYKGQPPFDSMLQRIQYFVDKL